MSSHLLNPAYVSLHSSPVLSFLSSCPFLLFPGSSCVTSCCSSRPRMTNPVSVKSPTVSQRTWWICQEALTVITKVLDPRNGQMCAHRGRKLSRELGLKDRARGIITLPSNNGISAFRNNSTLAMLAGSFSSCHSNMSDECQIMEGGVKMIFL